MPRPITLVAQGSRGDIQPYVALGVALQRQGHGVCLVAPALFAALAHEAGLPFAGLPVEADPQRLVRDPRIQAAAQRGGQLAVLFTLLRVVQPTLDALFAAIGQACSTAEALVAGNIPFGILDSAELCSVPAVWAPLHALRPTRAFPNVFFAPRWLRAGHVLNPATHHLMQATLWLAMRGALNRWRRSVGLRPHTWQSYFAWMEQRRTPTVYGFSSAVLPTPHEYPLHHQVSGYWFLDPPAGWQPPLALARFLANGLPPVAIGFGSMDHQRPAQVTSLVLEALQQSGQRAVLIAGWGGLGGGALPPEVLCMDDVPHRWLFPQTAAVVHHGGAGTTAAGLCAGVPSIITPVAADQFFWARRVAELGVGIAAPRLSQLSAATLATALLRATSDATMKHKAAALGGRLGAEDGAAHAARLIARVIT